MTKRQLTLQHQGKDVAPGKGISKLLGMKGAAGLYREPMENSIVPPSGSKVRVRVYASGGGHGQARILTQPPHHTEVHQAPSAVHRSLLPISLCLSVVERSIQASGLFKKETRITPKTSGSCYSACGFLSTDFSATYMRKEKTPSSDSPRASASAQTLYSSLGTRLSRKHNSLLEAPRAQRA